MLRPAFLLCILVAPLAGCGIESVGSALKSGDVVSLADDKRSYLFIHSGDAVLELPVGLKLQTVHDIDADFYSAPVDFIVTEGPYQGKTVQAHRWEVCPAL